MRRTISSSFLATKRLLSWGVLFFIGAVISVYSFYEWKIEDARQQEFQFYERHLNDKLNTLIQSKADMTQSIAITITTLPILKQALLNRDMPIQPILASYSQRFKDQTAYKEIWIQLISADGISLARSWTDRKNDNLSNIRQDIASVIQQPRYLNNFSVGKFALTFKSLVPIFDQERLIGILEVISHVNSIDRRLAESNGVRSVLLVNRDYRTQLTRSKTNKFIEDYYVANDAADLQDMALIKKVGVSKLFSNDLYLEANDHLLVSHPLFDLDGNRMANWVTTRSLKGFQFIRLEQTQRQFMLIALFVLVMVLLLVALIHFKRQSDFERRFFFQVFDTASEMVFVVKSRQMLLANKRFFDFFNQFDSVEAFHQQHRCICEFFVAENGYLKDRMGGEFWLDYLLSHSQQMHYAKIQQHGRQYIFSVKATEITSVEGERYISVLMSDVTDEYHYKDRLEHLIVEDELTGIYNRHYFNQVIDQEIKRHHRYQTPLSMLFIDVDHFKDINDQYGHDIGDLVLKMMSKTIQTLLRDTDVFCRVGGEEFVVIMPQTKLDDAIKMAERIRETISTLDEEPLPKPITISLGVAELENDENQGAFYKRADHALYRAKHLGRNQVATYHAELSMKNAG